MRKILFFLLLGLSLNSFAQTDFNYFGKDSSRIDDFREISKASQLQLYNVAIEKLQVLNSECGLTDAGYLQLASQYALIQDNRSARQILSAWVADGISDNYYCNYYQLLTSLYYFDKAYNDCIKACERAILKECTLSNYYELMARSHSQLGNDFLAVSNAKYHVAAKMSEDGITEADIRAHRVHNVNLGWSLALIAKSLVQSDFDTCLEYFKLSAACGFDKAVTICNQYHLSY